MASTIDAICWREQFHAEGNRFGMMRQYHEEQASFTLGIEHEEHRALADKWKLAQSLCYRHAGEVSHLAGIPEYGDAWNRRLQPHDLQRS